MAYAAIRRRLVEQHQGWMIRTYVVTVGFVFFRMLFTALRAAKVGTPREQLGASASFSWSVPLVVAEAFLQGPKIFHPRPPRGHPSGFLAHVTPETVARLEPLANVLRLIGAGVIQRVDNSVGADISPLEAKGVPGFAPNTDARHYFDYHHTPADTLDKVVPRELAENAAVLAVLAYGLANLSRPLPRLSNLGGK